MNTTNIISRILRVGALVAITAALSFGQAPRRGAEGRAARAPRPPQVVSPEVLADRKIVFRIEAPQAQKVGLNGGDLQGLSGDNAPVFTKGENGVWETTVGPIDPGPYRYTFNVDGVAVVDPRNPALSQSNNNVWSLVYVPGAAFMETQRVPHGAVAAVHYYSKSLDRERRMHVYTPPGYEAGGNQKYPVFYLLHGASDSDDSWTSIGRANFILDNLIASGKAKPMIVVMPAGHTSLARFGGGRGAAGAPRRDEFYEDFIGDIMPYVEKNYRAKTDRGSTAIAGLSMGGGQTLQAAFSNLNRFAYIGVFSSGASVGGGGNGGSWEEAHSADLDNASLKKGTKLIWFGTGVDDRLITRSRDTVEMLRKHGFNVEFEESSGGHVWINWRNYLNGFAPRLFQ